MTAATLPRTRTRRSVRLVLATVLLSVTALSAGPVAANAAALAPTSEVVPTGWPGRGGSRSGGQETDPFGSTGDRATTVDSEAATSAQSAGVVLIDTILGYQNAAAAGTGIVLTSTGEVLTNYHVVEGSTSIRVTIASTGQTYTASVVGHDEADDIALLQLKGASGLTVAKIDDDIVRKTDAVTAVGNAGGTDSLSAASGTVISLSRTITTQSEDGVAGETLHKLIETDADVVAGDSGGPLYDDENEVIGVTTAASTGAEINGYAIPIDRALSIVRQITSGTESGGVEIGASPFLGVEYSSQGYADGTSAQDTSLSTTSGVLIAGVVSGGPAADAGLEAGDMITAVGGHPVTSTDDLAGALAAYEPGERVAISWTDTAGTNHKVAVTLAASPIA